MDQNKKIILLFIYFIFFIFSFLMFFKIVMFMRGRDPGVVMSLDLFGKSFAMRSVQDSLEVKVVFGISCLLVVLSSFFLTATVISYNFDVIKDPEKKEEEEIKKIWEKD